MSLFASTPCDTSACGEGRDANKTASDDFFSSPSSSSFSASSTDFRIRDDMRSDRAERFEIKWFNLSRVRCLSSSSCRAASVDDPLDLMIFRLVSCCLLGRWSSAVDKDFEFLMNRESSLLSNCLNFCTNSKPDIRRSRRLFSAARRKQERGRVSKQTMTVKQGTQDRQTMTTITCSNVTKGLGSNAESVHFVGAGFFLLHHEQLVHLVLGFGRLIL
jgi:hypothetical protein